MLDYIYVAELSADGICVYSYHIIERSNDQLTTISENGKVRYFPNDFFKVAFSKEDAITFLINSYTVEINDIELLIKQKKEEIAVLEKRIPELKHLQRVVASRKK